jgi:calcium permeable stress-gated cation channel
MDFREREVYLFPRDSKTDQFLTLISNPFSNQVNTLNPYQICIILTACQIAQQSIWAAVGTSIGFTALIAIAFSFLRPYNSVVYAPKLKHADDKHAPPPVGRGIFAWVTPVLRTTEKDIILQVGLDATIFLRFLRMCRNIFITITVLGCGIIIPVNMTMSGSNSNASSWVLQVTPLATFGEANWALVVCAWLFNIVVAGFLWWNYRIVLRLRRQYFDSPEYQNSLHARTLMVGNYDQVKNMADVTLDL